jgi:hypothetical protein
MKKTMGANGKLLERYVERYNAGDLDTVMDLYAEDAVQIMPEGTLSGAWSWCRCATGRSYRQPVLRQPGRPGPAGSHAAGHDRVIEG